jgi:hypothetical protein
MVWAETIATYKELTEAESWDNESVVSLSDANAIVNRASGDTFLINRSYHVNILKFLSLPLSLCPDVASACLCHGHGQSKATTPT